MPRKSINFKLAVPFLLVIVIFLGISFYNVSNNKELLKDNEELRSTIEMLNSKILLLNEQLDSSISKVKKQTAELEKIRNKLTQERLQNVQLQQELDELRSKIFIDSQEESVKEAELPS